MKMMKQIIIICTVFFALFCIHPLQVEATGDVLTANPTGQTTGVNVTGTTDADVLAIVVQVRDASDNILTMETFSVMSGSYNATINYDLAAGDYKVYVANFDGGNWCIDDFTVVVTGGSGTGSGTGNGSGGGTGSGSGSGSSNGGNGTASSQNDSGSNEYKEVKVNVPIEYLVVKGDALGKIARKYHLTLQQLLSMNPQIKNPNLIRVGQKIVVGYTEKTVTTKVTDKSAENNAGASTNPVYYTVQRGDSLYKIARMNRLTLNKLISLNPDVMNKKYIYPGQKIRVK